MTDGVRHGGGLSTEAGRITITAIAHEAGVSVPTVSRVVNGRGDVAPQTRARVEELLRKHGYRRRTLGTRDRANLIDLVFHDLDSPWAPAVLRGVTSVAQAAGVGTVVSALGEGSPSARQWLGNLRARASDGVILVTSALEPRLHHELNRLHVPTVVIDPTGGADAEVDARTPTIGATNWSGGLAATEHLLGLGHRRIGFVSGPRRLLCSRARLDGYRAALGAAGLPAEAELIVPGDFSPESGLIGANILLDLPNPPTAIFAASDQMALGALEALRQRGLRVPEQISLVGFDDLPEARWCPPPLTTVRQPLTEMGRLAARTVLSQARGDDPDALRVELATELIVRASTAPPAG